MAAASGEPGRTSLCQATACGRPASKGCKNAFLGDPSGGEPEVSSSPSLLMLAYARLVPHSYHVSHGIAAYESGPPQGHKSVPTYLPSVCSKNGWFYFNSNGSAATRRRAALVRAAINMGISERERAVALSLPRGNAFDRRQWRRKGERVGAAVGDWQGGSAAADRAGHRKGETSTPPPESPHKNVFSLHFSSFKEK